MSFLAYHYFNAEDVLNITEFRELRVLESMHMLKKSRKLQFGSTIKNLLNEIGKKERIVDRPKSKTNIQLYFAIYVKELIDVVCSHLTDKNLPLGNVGYVLHVDRRIVDNLFMGSRTDLSEFIKNKTAVNMIMVDQGEKIAYTMLQGSQLKPPSFYVHANIEDNNIYLKLRQVVDTTSANGGVTQQSTVFIKDKTILFTGIGDQICEKLWNHIYSLDEKEIQDFVPLYDGGLKQCQSEYKSFKEALTFLIKEKVSSIYLSVSLLIPYFF